MKQPTFKSIVQEFKTKIESDYKLAKELYAKQDRITEVNTEVCNLQGYREEADDSEDFLSLERAYYRIKEEMKNYNGLMETCKITNIADIDDYGDGDYEVEYVHLHISYDYYIPRSEDSFNKLIDEESYEFSRLFKDFISNKLYIDSKMSYKQHLDCKMLELFKDKILDYNGLLKATYTNCTI